MEICPDQEGEEKQGGSHTELDEILAQDVPGTAGVHAADGGSKKHDVDKEDVITADGGSETHDVVPEGVIAAGIVGSHMTNNT